MAIVAQPMTLEEYLTYTTERKEKDARDLYIKVHGSFVKGLEEFVKDLKTSGKSLPAFVKTVLAKVRDNDNDNLKKAI